MGDALGAASQVEPALQRYDAASRTDTAVLALDRDEASAQAIQADVLNHRAEVLARAGRLEAALRAAPSSTTIREQRAAVIQSNATFAGLADERRHLRQSRRDCTPRHEDGGRRARAPRRAGLRGPLAAAQ